MNEKYCTHCGEKLPADAVFCSECGAAQQPAPMPEPVYDGVQEKIEENSGGIRPEYIVLTAFAMVLAALIIWLFLLANRHSYAEDRSVSKISASVSVPPEPDVKDGWDDSSSAESPADDYSGVGGRVKGSSKSGKEVYESGTYTVGVDIPAGEYMLYVEGDDWYFEDYDSGEYIPSFYVRISSGSEDKLRGWYQYSIYAKLEEGDVIDTTWADIYELDSSDVVNDPFAHPGVFMAGRDVEPGTYRIELLTDQGYQHYCIYDSIDEFMESNDLYYKNYGFSDGEEVTLENGQLIFLDFCRLRD